MKYSLMPAGRFQQIQSMVEVYLPVILADLVVEYVKTVDYSKKKFNRLRLLGQQQEEVNYQAADLEDSNLTLSQFFYCSFNETTFINATLFKITCIGCDFIRAEMTHANLTSLISSSDAPLDFTGAYLVESYFNEAKLPNAVFNHANCNQADFSGTDLTGARFYRTCLLGAKLTTAILNGTVLKQYPQIFFAILEKSRTPQNLLINLLNDYMGIGTILNMGRAFFKRQHFYPVREILTSKTSHVDEIKQFSIWMNDLEKLPRESDNDSLAVRLEFTKLCSGQN